jgi:hypothetical protein
MLFLLIELLLNKCLYLSTFNFHFSFPLSKRLKSISHFIHSIKVCDIELLSDLVSPLLNHLLELKLSLLPARHLRLQELLQGFQSRQHFLVPLDLIQSLSFSVFYNCSL